MTKLKYEINGINCDVNVIYTSNKNSYLKVNNDTGEIIIRIGKYHDDNVIETLLSKNFSRITKHINNTRVKREKYYIRYEDGEEVYLYGEKYILKIILNNQKKSDVCHDLKIISLYVTSDELGQKRKLLDEFYKEQAELTFLKSLNKCYTVFTREYPLKNKPTLKIKKLKSSWGIWRHDKNQMTLNLNLIKYEIDLIEYVIYHELSHSVEQNHSKQFYNVKSQFVPDYKIKKKKLSYS